MSRGRASLDTAEEEEEKDEEEQEQEHLGASRHIGNSVQSVGEEAGKRQTQILCPILLVHQKYEYAMCVCVCVCVCVRMRVKIER